MKKLFYFILILGCLQSCNQKPARDTVTVAPYTDTLNAGDTTTPSVPKPIGMVSDFAGIFTKGQMDSLEKILTQYEKRTTNEIAVATVNSWMVDSAAFENYTLDMARVWGVGKKGKDNGVLIVIAPHLRRIRIQNGYGIEKILSNEETKQIIDKVFIPEFKKGDFYRGTHNGIAAIIAKLDSKK